MAKPVKDAQTASKNWADAMASPMTQTKYRDGVSRVTDSPMQKAATPDALNRYAANTQAAAAPGGRMAAGLSRVTLDQWKQAAIGAAANLQAGAQRKKAKQAAAAQRLQPVWQAMRDSVANMPKGGAANAIARVTAALTVQAQMTGRQ